MIKLTIGKYSSTPLRLSIRKVYWNWFQRRPNCLYTFVRKVQVQVQTRWSVASWTESTTRKSSDSVREIAKATRALKWTVSNVITKVNYEVALDSDPTRILVVHRNHRWILRSWQWITDFVVNLREACQRRQNRTLSQRVCRKPTRINQLKRLLNDSTFKNTYLYFLTHLVHPERTRRLTRLLNAALLIHLRTF